MVARKTSPARAVYAYADPPYLGVCARYGHHHPDGRCWDDLATHAALVDRLTSSYPDGWALSLSSRTLPDILPLCPAGVRVAAWTKPFAAFKKGVRIAYTWEPVIVAGGRTTFSQPGLHWTRDHLSESMTRGRGLVGVKPDRFNLWILAMLGYLPGDTLDDLFPGKGGMARAVELAAAVLPVVADYPTLELAELETP